MRDRVLAWVASQLRPRQQRYLEFIDDATPLFSTGVLFDSFVAVNLITWLEAETGINGHSMDFEALDTVGGIVAFLERHSTR